MTVSTGAPDRTADRWVARRSKGAAALAGCGLLAGLAGLACDGTATLRFVSLNSAAIDPPPPDEYRFDPQACYYWIDGDGRLNVAMQYDVALWWGPMPPTLQLSFVLDDPPAGRGRDYAVRTRTVRGRLVSAFEHHRFASLAGVVSAERRSSSRLDGSFRVWLQHVAQMPVFMLMPQKPGALLLFGRYSAVENAEKGARIRTATESQGWQRPPSGRASSAPASRPASAH